ncbi:MAG TPA: glycosyl hydrolase [Polyangiaceae bacterium]|nr:glycosyl hydrolase [Polyangiaceae bacterium]
MWHRRPILELAPILLVLCGCSGESGSNSANGGGPSADAAAPQRGDGAVGAAGSTNGASVTSGTGGASGTAANGGNTNGNSGSSNTGGNSSGNSSGGKSAANGAAGSNTGGNAGSNTGGNAGSGGTSASTTCKRGIAANTAPGAAFFPAIGWWYDWSMQRSGADVGIEFVPMMWGKSDVNTAIPKGAKYLLTFNEPNFHSQSNLTPQQAASYWPTIEMVANAAHVPIVSPAMNFCGPEDQCNGTSPYQYLKDFFTACTNCKVDYVAVHWYNCDLPSLQDYLEPGGSLEGFEQFDKPIWLTEFSCNGGASEADQEKFMRAAIPLPGAKSARVSLFVVQRRPHPQRRAHELGWIADGPG